MTNTFEAFIANHISEIVFKTFLTGIITAMFALIAYPSWKRKAKRAMRRGMADTSSKNPFFYVAVLTVAVLIITCFTAAGSDPGDWIADGTERVSLKGDAQVLRHYDDGSDLISVINGEDVYVFRASDVNVEKLYGASEMVIEHRKAFLRPGRDKVSIR